MHLADSLVGQLAPYKPRRAYARRRQILIAENEVPVDLPLGLVSALESGECVLFLGSGVGYNMFRDDGSHLPDGEMLARSLAGKFSIDVDEHPNLAQVAQIVELRHDRARLVAHVEKELSGFEPDENMKWLASLTWRAIFTTNYDSAIERAYELVPEPMQAPVVIATNSETRSWDPRFQVPIFHLHGSLATVEAKEAILITEQDYATFRLRRQMLFEQLRLSYATTPILYVGYSHKDPNWRMITTELRAEFEPNRPPQSYRLVPETPPLDREILDAQGITTVDGSLADLRLAVRARIGDVKVDPRDLDALVAKVPTDLRELFKDSPAAVTRMLNSWDYVNQADFSAAPNSSAFHRGDRANWSLIGKGINFQRDLEEPLVEGLIEFATDPSPRVTSQIILGSAGYGTSTLLMAVAAWFVQNKVGTTLFLRPGASPSPADVEFAARNLPAPIIFCVDNAADYERDLTETRELLHKMGIPALLLLGERVNEWRQCRPTLRPREFMLEPLSDVEVWRLIDSLAAAGSLGKLADLEPELRFAAIKIRNQQQLLVTMREATEGRAFDAIIEDEYRSIESETAKSLYGLVCAFSRVRALARDSLCADALEVSLTDLFPLLKTNLEGIVEFEVIDEARQIEGLRARHQIIADIVWNRCLDRAEYERLLLRALDALNLSFGADVKAFEKFTRDVEAVDNLNTLDAKTRFFEIACRKDPLNGYVRQHYGRMLLREGKLELALGQVDQGLELSPHAKVIRHTRGMILREMAVQATAPEVGRRRLAQSEEAFEGSLRQNPRDEYSYQSLSELYIDWARKSKDPAETVDYLNRAQAVIFRGLQNVRQREGLYLVSAKIASALGDAPGRIDALRNAVAAAPTSAVPRYMLGTALRREGNFAEAGETLLAGLKLYPDDPFLSLALALTYHEDGKDYRESIAVLHLARIKGQRDPDFIATYGGMLVMDEQLEQRHSQP
jgi:tetratricopeptide (TPR) repeat protein